MDLQLANRVAVVTGATRGIGRAVCIVLASEGVKLVLAARNRDELRSVADEVESLGRVRPVLVACDLADLTSPKAVIDASIRAWARIDIVVNNAGGALPLGLDEAQDESLWEEAFALQFHAVRRLSYGALPGMRSNGWGRIINITGSMEPEGVNGSNIAKAAVHQWAKGLSVQLARDGITVNCLSPGRIRTAQSLERRKSLPPEQLDKEMQSIPVGHFGEPQDVAVVVAFLASPLARYITGEVVHVDGGRRKHAF